MFNKNRIHVSKRKKKYLSIIDSFKSAVKEIIRRHMAIVKYDFQNIGFKPHIVQIKVNNSPFIANISFTYLFQDIYSLILAYSGAILIFVKQQMLS